MTDHRHPSRRAFLASSLTSAVLAPTAWGAEPKALVKYDQPADFTVIHRAQITGGTVNLSSLEVWLPIPVDDREQSITDVRVPPSMGVIDDQTRTVRVAREIGHNLGAGGMYAVELTYHVRAFRIQSDLDRIFALKWDEPGTATKSTKAKTSNTSRSTPGVARNPLWLRREPQVQTDDARIKAKARELKSKTEGPGRFAFAVYEWVMEQTNYRLVGDFKGALFCLENRCGECGDYSALFIALCRAAGIPARPCVGFWLSGKTNDLHVWAEFQLPTGEWVPVDASLGDTNDYQRRACFGYRDNRRVAVAKTYETRVPTRGMSRDSVHILQVGSWWYTFEGPVGSGPKADFRVKGEPLGSRAERTPQGRRPRD